MGIKSGLMVTISVRKCESLAFKERMAASTSPTTRGCFMLDTLALKYLLVMDLSVATCNWKYFDYIQVRDRSQRWSHVQPLHVSESENLGNA